MDGQPTWSPDGSKIAYSSSDDVFVIEHADGSSMPIWTERMHPLSGMRFLIEHRLAEAQWDLAL